MSVSAIGSLPITSPFYTSPVSDSSSADATQSASPKPKSQFRSDLATLINDVQSGDMSSAKQALTVVQNDISAANAAYSPQSASGGQQLPPDLQHLFDAVQNGDTTAAQAALKKMQSDAPRGGGEVRGHHHRHRASNAAQSAGNDAQAAGNDAQSAGAAGTSAAASAVATA
jgi:hypothetical protein